MSDGQQEVAVVEVEVDAPLEPELVSVKEEVTKSVTPIIKHQGPNYTM